MESLALIRNDAILRDMYKESCSVSQIIEPPDLKISKYYLVGQKLNNNNGMKRSYQGSNTITIK
jgi:hypothetical protein